MQHELDRQLAALPAEIRGVLDWRVADNLQWRERTEERPYQSDRGYQLRGTFLIVEWRPYSQTSVVVWDAEQARRARSDTTMYGRAPTDVPVAGTSEMLLNFATASSFRAFLVRYMRYQVLITKLFPGEQHAQVEAPQQPAVDQPLPPNVVDADE